MNRLITLTTLLLALAIAACSTDSEVASVKIDVISSPIGIVGSNSSIVSQMENHYRENTVLPIDPCRDRFIYDMELIGFKLDADVILPKGGQRFGYWFATCLFKSEHLSALIESSTAPFMRPDQSLAPSNEVFMRSHYINIGERRAIVRPYANSEPNCMLSIATSFGSMTITGGLLDERNPAQACPQVERLARQFEPWIDD